MWKLFFSNWKSTPETENVKHWRIPNFLWGLKCLWIPLCSYFILISTSYFILFYSVLFYSILFYSILFYSILFYSILFYSILFYSILFYSTLFYSILFYLSHHGIIYNIYFLVSEKVYFKSQITVTITLNITRTFSHSNIVGFGIAHVKKKKKKKKKKKNANITFSGNTWTPDMIKNLPILRRSRI